MENNRRRTSRRYQRQRKSLMNAIVVLGVVLVALLVVLVFLPEKPEQGHITVQLHKELTIEAGSDLPSAQSFLAEDANVTLTYADPGVVDNNKPGVYQVVLQYGSKKETVEIKVVDTVAPQGKVQNLMANPDRIPDAKDFVVEPVDATEITYSYLQQPDKTVLGVQNIAVVMTDTSGNSTTLQATLTLDAQAPVLQGVKDMFIYVGDTVSYLSGVTVTDDWDTNIADPQVNRDQVDLQTPGVYQVIYTATDAAGNTTAITIKLTVMEKGENFVSTEEIYAQVDKILDEIITDDMSDYEKVQAVYWWIVNNCRYTSHSEKDNWMQAGYRMLTERRGDCFNYFGLCKLMLERLGIPNIDVTKVPNFEGDSNHYWSLVSIDGGQTYYHVDTTPRTVPVYFCLVTDQVIDEFSASYRNCFNRDKSLYPATPEVGP